MKIVLSGNPIEGFTAYGPYDNLDDALNAIGVHDRFESAEMFVLELHPVEEL